LAQNSGAKLTDDFAAWPAPTGRLLKAKAEIQTDPFPSAPSRACEGNAANSSRRAGGYRLRQHYLTGRGRRLGQEPPPLSPASGQG